MGDGIARATALLVGDHALGHRAVLAPKFAEVRAAATVGAAVRALAEAEARIDFALIDVDSVEGSMLVAVLAGHERAPRVVFAMHAREVTTNDAFAFAKCGVSRLVPAGLDASELARAVDDAFADPPLPVRQVLSRYLGRVGLFELERSIRRAAVLEALARTEGNRSEAARMLDVPRPVIQRELKSTSASKRRSAGRRPSSRARI